MPEKIAISFGDRTKREPYLDALRSVGLDFVENPATLDMLSGLMLTGGTDVDPARYGEKRKPETDEPDLARDERDTALLHDALACDLPILAICRGMQLLNVALGGTLTQHVEDHRRRGEPNAHPVHIRERTKLASILKSGEYPVNSRHHQSVAILGGDLLTSATAPDGIIEAVELPSKRYAIGVQWHPEDRIHTTDDRKLFEAFAEAIQTVSATVRA